MASPIGGDDCAIGTCTTTTEVSMGVITEYSGANAECSNDPVGSENFCTTHGGTWE